MLQRVTEKTEGWNSQQTGDFVIQPPWGWVRNQPLGNYKAFPAPQPFHLPTAACQGIKLPMCRKIVFENTLCPLSPPDMGEKKKREREEKGNEKKKRKEKGSINIFGQKSECCAPCRHNSKVSDLMWSAWSVAFGRYWNAIVKKLFLWSRKVNSSFPSGQLPANWYLSSQAEEQHFL